MSDEDYEVDPYSFADTTWPKMRQRKQREAFHTGVQFSRRVAEVNRANRARTDPRDVVKNAYQKAEEAQRIAQKAEEARLEINRTHREVARIQAEAQREESRKPKSLAEQRVLAEQRLQDAMYWWRYNLQQGMDTGAAETESLSALGQLERIIKQMQAEHTAQRAAEAREGAAAVKSETEALLQWYRDSEDRHHEQMQQAQAKISALEDELDVLRRLWTKPTGC
jgi:hypothetical protein